MSTLLSNLSKRALHARRDRIDGFALRPAVLVIDTISLIVAADQAGSDEIRDRTADIGTPGVTQTGANFVRNHFLRQILIVRKHVAPVEFRANLLHNG